MPGPELSARVACPGCGAEASRTLLDVAYDEPELRAFLSGYYRGFRAELLAGGRYVVLSCAGCTLVYQQNVPTEVVLVELYDRWLNSGAHDDPNATEALLHPRQSRDGQELLAAAAVLGRPARALRVLDYGMGWALWGRVAKALGATVYGYDVSAERMAAARTHGIVATEDINGLGLDFINAEQVIEHLVDPRGAAQRFWSALRPGGIVKIAVPQDARIERAAAQRRFDRLNAIHPLEHLNLFTPKALDRLAESAGLTPVPLPILAHYRALRVFPFSMRRFSKGVLRPVYHRVSRANLYRWYVRR